MIVNIFYEAIFGDLILYQLQLVDFRLMTQVNTIHSHPTFRLIRVRFRMGFRVRFRNWECPHPQTQWPVGPPFLGNSAAKFIKEQLGVNTSKVRTLKIFITGISVNCGFYGLSCLYDALMFHDFSSSPVFLRPRSQAKIHEGPGDDFFRSRLARVCSDKTGSLTVWDLGKIAGLSIYTVCHQF